MKFILFATAIAKTIYFIRHGEQDDSSGKDLSAQGYTRAQCLVNVFTNSFKSPESIIAQDPSDHSHRALETVQPLAQHLGLQVLDSCDRDDISCAVDLINQQLDGGSKKVLVAWEHKQLAQIATNFVDEDLKYPGSEYDLIWIVDTKTRSLKINHENC
ncbi:hypothetical protein HDV04_004436 [Boothiomyces sp. JEL0838]|nr:hypothetical protein HDV04_004436 [Boothiomyces sp. JEL0838]